MYPRYRPACPRGFQQVEAPRFLDSRHMNVVRSSPLRNGRLYPPGINQYSLLEAESTSGRLYHQEYYGINFQRLNRPGAHGLVGCFGKNPQWHERGSIPGPSDQQRSTITTTLPQALCLNYTKFNFFIYTRFVQ